MTELQIAKRQLAIKYTIAVRLGRIAPTTLREMTTGGTRKTRATQAKN